MTNVTNGPCPTCGSHEVYRSNASPRSSDRVTIREVSFGSQDASSETRFICTTCGYLKYYLLDEHNRKAIELSWQRIQKS